MDEQSRRDFLTRYATLALSAVAAAGAGKTLLAQQEPPVALYGPPPRDKGPPFPPKVLYGPPPRDRQPPIPTPSTPDDAG
jgi:hypothetical protein